MQFTPHVTCIHTRWRERTWEAVLLEAAASLRLWGGLKSLLALLRSQGQALGLTHLTSGSTGLVALARLFCRPGDQAVRRIDDLPLEVLAQAWP
ncbi:MAG: DNA polymerase Y family protein, partial [Brachymonas sp.]